MLGAFWASLLVVALAGGAFACTEGDSQAIEGKCREFKVCKNGTWVKDNCVTLLRKYSKEEKKCKWWFQVDCEEHIQCTENNQYFKSPYSCRSYYQCEDGKLNAKSCWPLYTFDGSSCRFQGSCETPVSFPDSRERTKESYADPCSGDDVEPIAGHCYWYKKCASDGFFYETSCPLGKWFSVETKTCEWFWKVSCEITTCDGKARAPSNTNSTYYQCVDGYLMKKTCGTFQSFNPKKGECTFGFSQLNKELVQTNMTTKVNASEPQIKVVSTLVEDKTPQKMVPEVKDKNWNRIKRAIYSGIQLNQAQGCTDGEVSADINCLKYKICENNNWVTKTCPNQMIYSNKQCRFYWTASCDAGSCIVGEKSPYLPDCTKYYLCDSNHKNVLEDCPRGAFWVKKHYNPTTHECENVLAWAKCPDVSSYMACPEGETKPGKTKNEYEICSDLKWTTVKCISSDIYVPKTGGCGCAKEADHKAAINASYYLECEDGRWVQLKCLLGNVFNPATKMCETPSSRSKRSVDTSASKANPIDCIDGDSKFDVKPGVCSTYMYCHVDKWVRRACPTGMYFEGNGKCSTKTCTYQPVPSDCTAFRLQNGAVVKCEFGMRFDKITKQCVDFAKANCAKVECEGTERKNHPTSCKLYLQCSNQQWTVDECGWFKDKFDMDTRTCVFGLWGNQAHCRYDPVNCTEGTQTPVGDNCREYLTCSNDTQRLNSCWWPKKFDTVSSKCVWWGAKCG